jgi:NADP-dependent 3-hydroxy acid dehydrogenase YdfG
MTICSIAGHYDVSAPGFHMYSATKHAVTALTEGLRRELVTQHTNIRVTVSTIVPLTVLPTLTFGAKFATSEIRELSILTKNNASP